ncbi:MAG: peptide chain release factor N(5)-glutamine methyltransferase [Treponema sp.]|nr:peptide chain release factor N(5)-glutamine methyltransferase [Treponema sp.]
MSQNLTVKEFKNLAVSRLCKSPSPSLDADVILQHFLKVDRTWLLMHRDDVLQSDDLVILEEAINKRMTGLPVAYITGVKEFYGRNFFVCPDVLIPKPDTEILVEKAAALIKNRIRSNPDAVLNVADICTGSGCIAVSVLAEVLEEYPEAKINFFMTDISQKALDVAVKNISVLDWDVQVKTDCIKNDDLPVVAFVDYKNVFVKVLRGDLLCGLDSLDFILTNPPYIPKVMVDELLLDGRNEPRLALDGDTDIEETSSDGLAIVRRLFVLAKKSMNDDAVMLCETGEYNAKTAADYATALGFKNVNILQDLEGQDRVVICNA